MKKDLQANTNITQQPELADRRFNELRDALNDRPRLTASNKELGQKIQVLTNRTEIRNRLRTNLSDLRGWQNRNPATAKVDGLLTRLMPRFVTRLLGSVGVAPTYTQQATDAKDALASPDNAVVGLDQAKVQLQTQKAQLDQIERLLGKIAEYKRLPNEEINQDAGKKTVNPTRVGLTAKREYGPGGRLSFTLYLPDKTGAFSRKVSIDDVAPFLQRQLITFFQEGDKTKKPIVLVKEHLFRPDETSESSAGLSGLIGNTDWNHTQLVDVEFVGLEQVTTKQGQKIIQLPDGFRKIQLLSEAENITSTRGDSLNADHANTVAVNLIKAMQIGADEETVEVLLESIVDSFQQKATEQIKSIQKSADFGVTWAGTSYPFTFEEVTDSLKALRILGAPDSDGEQAIIKILQEYAGDIHDDKQKREELLDGVLDLKQISSLIDYREISGRMEGKRQAVQRETDRVQSTPEIKKQKRNVKVFVGNIGLYDMRSVRYITIVASPGEETTLRIPIGTKIKECCGDFFAPQQLAEIEQMFDREQGPIPAKSWDTECTFIQRRANDYRTELPGALKEYAVNGSANPDTIEYEDMEHHATVVIKDPEGVYEGPTVRIVTITPYGGGDNLTARIPLDENIYPEAIFDEKQLSRFDEQWLFDSMIQAKELDEWDMGRSISVKVVRTVGSSTLKLRPDVQKYVVKDA